MKPIVIYTVVLHCPQWSASLDPIVTFLFLYTHSFILWKILLLFFSQTLFGEVFYLLNKLVSQFFLDRHKLGNLRGILYIWSVTKDRILLAYIMEHKNSSYVWTTKNSIYYDDHIRVLTSWLIFKYMLIMLFRILNFCHRYEFKTNKNSYTQQKAFTA